MLGLHCCAWAFSSCSKWGLLFIAVHELLSAVTSLVCGAQALCTWASVAAAQRLSSWGELGLVAPRHVESSRTRDRTCVPCISRRILTHSTTREVLHLLKLLGSLDFLVLFKII